MQKLGNHGQHILVFRQFTWVYWLTEFPCMSICHSTHCVKSVRIWCYSCPHFPTFGLNTERYGVSLRIQSECGKMRTRITPNTDTFHAVTRLPVIWKVVALVLPWKIFPGDRLKYSDLIFFWDDFQRLCSSFFEKLPWKIVTFFFAFSTLTDINILVIEIKELQSRSTNSRKFKKLLDRLLWRYFEELYCACQCNEMLINNATVYQVYISTMDLFSGSFGYLLVTE